MSNLLFLSLENTLQQVLLVIVALSLLVFSYFRLKRDGKGDASDEFEKLYKKISENIKYAVSPKFVELSIGVKDLVELAVEVWRMEQRIAKSASGLPENQLKGLENSIQKLRRYLEKYDIEIVDYKNAKYNDGLNLDILSV